MGIQQIFVSHAGEDVDVATELAEQLRNAGHETKIDVRDLSLGDDAIAFMNEGIANAAVVIILFSEHTPKAVWQQLEIDAAVWSEVAQDGGRCIVVRLDDTPIPPILGHKVYTSLERGDHQSLKKLVEEVCGVLFSGQTTSSLVAEAFKPDSENPFRHLRAEFFENQPELHAKTFALPEAVKVGALDDMKPCILEGSRGTGKSMLLLSLRARNLLSRLPDQTDAPQRFGFYLKLARGAICNAGALFDPEHLNSTVDTAVLTDIAEQELMVQITESLFSELAYCAGHGLIDCNQVVERRLCEEANDLLFDALDGGIVSFLDVQFKLGKLHRQLAEFIRRRFIYQEEVSVPTATFDMEQLKRVVQLVKRHVPPLASSMFVVLLDEYENLFLHQKRLINTLVKLGPPQISIKIARKLASGDTPGTTTGQELQEIHDYTRVPLVYNLEDPTERRAYSELLQHMVENMVALEGDRPFDMDELLPRFAEPEVEESSWLVEVARLNKMTVAEFNDQPDEKQREKKRYYGPAAVYRVLLRGPGRPRDKRFAGFRELTLLGSGVIRYFQEFLSVTYHLTFGAKPPPTGALVLPPDQQSRAVHVVSQHNLTTLSRNVERYGEELKYFLLDLGDCLRYKLLKHSSEPEAARVTIDDPEMLEQGTMAKLKQVLAVGAREGVFQTREGLPAFKPKHGSDPQPTEFNISRVYAPVLQISPRLRWRTTLKCRHLQGLLEPGRRTGAVRELRNAVSSAEDERVGDRLPLEVEDNR